MDAAATVRMRGLVSTALCFVSVLYVMVFWLAVSVAASDRSHHAAFREYSIMHSKI